MNEKETKNLLTLAIGAFPSMHDKNMHPTAKVWGKVLADIPYNVAEDALLRTLSTTKEFPTLAEIREAVILNAQSCSLTTGEAYQEVIRAINKFGRYGEGLAMETLSPLTRRVARSVGWDSLCLNNKHDARAQFRKEYEKQEKRDAIEARVPQSLKL